MDYWKAGDHEKELVQKYLKYHPDLVGANIAVIFREKATKSDGRPIIGKITKTSNKYMPLFDEEYHYILELAADVWHELARDKQEAWIDFLLEHAYGEESESTGEMRWKTRKPEMVAFPVIITRHGVTWNEGLSKLQAIDINGRKKAVEAKKRAEDSEDEDYDALTEDL